MRKYIVTKLSSKFSEAVELVKVPMPQPSDSQILIKNRFVGINASDINCTAARFKPSSKPPFDCGFEAVGEIASIGSKCSTQFKVGQPVGYFQDGAFSEYIALEENVVIPMPACEAEYVSLLVSGLTAAISLDKVGCLQPNETVLVTAAAGGTGQFAVQWARVQGCHVIGTCSNGEKADFLKSIGCDRVVDLSKENLKQVLEKEYPNGVDVVYESIGGEVFETCVNALAVRGRLIVIGYISGYESDTGRPDIGLQLPSLVQNLLKNSTSVCGFFIFHYAQYYGEYLEKLVALKRQKKISCSVDLGGNCEKGKFSGIESIPRAVEYLYSRKSKGKIAVELPN